MQKVVLARKGFLYAQIMLPTLRTDLSRTKLSPQSDLSAYQIDQYPQFGR
jgi:hypothetical protein